MRDLYCELADILAKRSRLDLLALSKDISAHSLEEHNFLNRPSFSILPTKQLESSQSICNWLDIWKILSSKNVCKQAAVLLPLFKKNNTLHLLLTKRTDKVAYHKGEISFPGGAMDAKDSSLLDTALRETEEEIGIPQEQIRILGVLDDAFTLISQFTVTPYLGVIPFPYSLNLNNDETKEILEIPLDFFLTHQNFWEGTFHYQSYEIRSYFFQWKPDSVIWGMTAYIIQNLCNIVLQHQLSFD